MFWTVCIHITDVPEAGKKQNEAIADTYTVMFNNLCKSRLVSKGEWQTKDNNEAT